MTVDEIVPYKVGAFSTENQIILLPPMTFCYFRRSGAMTSVFQGIVAPIALRQGPKSGGGARGIPPEERVRGMRLRLFGCPVDFS